MARDPEFERRHPRDARNGRFVDRFGGSFVLRALGTQHGDLFAADRFRRQGTGAGREMSFEQTDTGPTSRPTGWLNRLSDGIDSRRVARGADAMDAAGTHWDGDSDNPLGLWLHEHSNWNGQLFGLAGADDHSAAIKALDKALRPSKRPMVVYRGTDAQLSADREFTNPGFSATSVDEAVARRYAEVHGGTVLEMHVPAGIRSGSIGTAPDMADWDFEDLEESGEVVLERGLIYKVVGGRGNRLVVEVRRG